MSSTPPDVTGIQSPNSLPYSAEDIVQQSFALPPPMVACLVRHLNRSMSQVSTPHSVEHCVVELQSYFQPYIEASRVNEWCLPGSRLRLQFGKAMDVDIGASSSLLNLYIHAVDQEFSRPRLLAHVAKEWRAQLEKFGRESSCFVMLFHQTLIDASSVSLRHASGEDLHSTTDGKLNQKKVDAAVALMETYFEELRTLKFAPHQMSAYMPNVATIRVMERLRAAYVERSAQLSGLFEDYQQQKKQLQRKGTWNLHECWRRGYNLVVHYLQFSAVAEAMVVLSRMFGHYYYHSEDYTFVQQRSVLERLAKLPNLFDPVRSGTVLLDGTSGYPAVLQDNAEFIDGLLFIAAWEMRCAALLGQCETAFAMFSSFVQVAREKLSEQNVLDVIGDHWRCFFLLRCYLSVLSLDWNPYSSKVKVTNSSSNKEKEEELDLANFTPLLVETEIKPHGSCSLNSKSSNINYNDSSNSVFFYKSNHSNMDERNLSSFDNDKVVVGRLQELCEQVGMKWAKDKVFLLAFLRQHCRRLAQITSEAVEILLQLGGHVGYQVDLFYSTKISFSLNPTTKTVSVEATEFSMAELSSIATFANLYRTLMEMSAICYHRIHCFHLSMTQFYRFALACRQEDPGTVVDLCHQRLLPFVMRHGWAHLQAVVHGLYVDAMEALSIRRVEKGEIPLLHEEAGVLREALLRLIRASATGEDENANEVRLLSNGLGALDLWRRFCRVEAVLPRQRAIIPFTVNEPHAAGPFNLGMLISAVQVQCRRLEESEQEVEKEEKRGSLTVQLGENVEFCVDAKCPVDLIHSSGSPNLGFSVNGGNFDNVKGGNGFAGFSGEYVDMTIGATLVSKRDWDDPEEVTHVVHLTRLAPSSMHDVETQRLHWVWNFIPCHAGEYHLRCLTVHVAGAALVYEAEGPYSEARITETLPTPSLEPAFTSSILGHSAPPYTSSNGTPNQKVESGGNGPLFIVPEPDIGIKMHVTPPEESHCFADMRTFFTIDVEIEKPLYLPQGRQNMGGERGCMFEPPASSHISQNSLKACPSQQNALHSMASISSQDSLLRATSCAAAAAAAAAAFAVKKANKNNAAASTITTAVAPSSDPRALAVISVGRARRVTPVRTGLGPLHHSHSQRPRISPAYACISPAAAPILLPDAETAFTSSGSVALLVITDDRTGAMTTVPLNEAHALSDLPAPIGRRSGGAGHGDGEMRLDGQIILPRQQCRFSIRLNDEHVGADAVDAHAALDATSLRCALPLLPIFMAGGEELAQVSFCCQRKMETCSTSFNLPLRFTQAFAVQYTFKCSQSRVYCVAQVENVLPRSSLWLRGAVLELLDADKYYELVRVSSTHERIMMREWRPGERVNLFFELAPTAEPHAHTEELQHKVRLQLFYSSWSLVTGFDALEPHILRPMEQKQAIKTDNSWILSNNSAKSNSLDIEKPKECHDANINSRSSEDDDVEDFAYIKQRRVVYDTVQVDLLRHSCNTYHAPLATFTSRYSCLFTALIFVDPHDEVNVSAFAVDAATRGTCGMGETGSSTTPLLTPLNSAEAIHSTSTNLPGGVVFPVGDPVRFSVRLEPLAHNWPEESECVEEFLISFVVDPAVWLVTGRQRMRVALPMMDDVTLRFTAVPVPQVGKGENRKQVVTVATPTVEIYWASRQKETSVAIEVVQFRAFMRILV